MRRSLAIAALVTSMCGSAAAADPSGTTDSSWVVQITPYVWGAALDGRISPFARAPAIDVDKSFSDILDDLNLGAFVNVWARRDRLVFLLDLMYVDTTDAEAYGPLPPLSVPVPPGTVVNGEVDTRQVTATIAAGYRVLDTPDFTVDALAGARYWDISNRVTVSALGMSRSYKEGFDWVDPLVGVRAFWRLPHDFSVMAQADIGGFDAASKLTWSATLTVNYVVNDQFSLSAGYRALDVDYERDGHLFDTRLSGPVLGLTYRF